MKILVLNNLSAGPGDGAIYDFIRIMSKPGDEVVVRSVEDARGYAAILADASRFDCVVISGGDGTVSQACYELRYSNVPVLVFPSGTANLIAQNILLPSEIPALAAMVRDGYAMDFDMGEFDFGYERRGFMMMAGCGFDERIMSTAGGMKERMGTMAYFRAAFEHVEPPVSDITIEVDGNVTKTRGVGIVAMNFSKVQFDVRFSSENLPSDGQLDVCVLATKNAWELIPAAIGAALDRTGKALMENESLLYYRGKHIQVDANPAMNVELDGEPVGFSTPFSISVLPHAAKLIVTQECIDEFSN